MKTYNLIQIGFGIMQGAAVFSGIQTAWFGFNWKPHTTPEIVCDAISASFAAVGLTLYLAGKYQQFRKYHG